MTEKVKSGKFNSLSAIVFQAIYSKAATYLAPRPPSTVLPIIWCIMQLSTMTRRCQITNGRRYRHRDRGIHRHRHRHRDRGRHRHKNRHRHTDRHRGIENGWGRSHLPPNGRGGNILF